MRVRYIGSFDAVEVTGIPGVVTRGEIIDVPAELAGRIPAPRVAVALAELVDAEAVIRDAASTDEARAASQQRSDALRAELAAADTGAGLLAQIANWEPVKLSNTKGDAA